MIFLGINSRKEVTNGTFYVQSQARMERLL